LREVEIVEVTKLGHLDAKDIMRISLDRCDATFNCDVDVHNDDAQGGGEA